MCMAAGLHVAAALQQPLLRVNPPCCGQHVVLGLHTCSALQRLCRPGSTCPCPGTLESGWRIRSSRLPACPSDGVWVEVDRRGPPGAATHTL